MCLLALWLFCEVPPPQATSIIEKRTNRLSNVVNDLTFTLEDIAGRELGVMYNLLSLDELFDSTNLINMLWIAPLNKRDAKTACKFSCSYPSFQVSFHIDTTQYFCQQVFQISLCGLLYLVLVHLSSHLDHYTRLLYNSLQIRVFTLKILLL